MRTYGKPARATATEKKTCATNVSVIVDLIPELVDALPLMYASLKCDLNLYPKAFDM